MKRILIVEDEEDIGLLLSAMLKNAGYEVAYAPDALKAKELIRSDQFQFILLDLNLGNSHGLDLMPSIKRFQTGAEVIVISAYTDDSVQKAVFAQGIKQFIKKPFSKAQVLKAME